MEHDQPKVKANKCETFKNDPVPINVILLSLALLVGLALVAFVWRKSHKIQRENIEEEAEEARETLMPNASEINGYGSMNGSGTASPGEEDRGRRM